MFSMQAAAPTRPQPLIKGKWFVVTLLHLDGVEQLQPGAGAMFGFSAHSHIVVVDRIRFRVSFTLYVNAISHTATCQINKGEENRQQIN